MEEVHETTLNRIAHEITQKRTRIYTNFFVLFSVIFLSFVPVRVEAASAASLYISPSSGTYSIGKTISVSIYVSSPSQAMNAVSGIVSFPPDKLEVTSLSKIGSIISLWVQEPTFVNSVGTANFEGVVLNPGFTGQSGKVLTINFRVKSGGTASLRFSSASVLANDGKGTNILSAMSGGNYILQGPVIITPLLPEDVLVAPVVSSLTHPNPEKWYSNNNPEFSWKLAEGAIGVSFSFDQKYGSEPGIISEGLIKSKKFKNVQDGIWYFHIKFQTQDGWGEVFHRKVLIDTKAPEPFEIKTDNAGDLTNPTPLLYFKTTDSLSGIERYEIKIGEGNIFSLTSGGNPYKLPPQSPGKHSILINAFDKAGNSTQATGQIEVLVIETPKIKSFPSGLIEGQYLNLTGSSLPEVYIKTFVQKKGFDSGILLGQTQANKDGVWLASFSQDLKGGDYLAWVEAQDKRGALSLPSQKVGFWVGLPPFLRIGKIAIDYMSVIITLFVLLVGAITLIVYGWYRISLWRKRIRKESRDIGKSTVRAFRNMREDILKQIEYFDKKPGLSQKEKEMRDKLQASLDASEKSISQEIEEVEKELE